MGFLTSQDPDTLEGLESWFSVGIYRIPTEFPHSTKLELRKLHRTRMDYGRASALELLQGFPQAGKSSGPHNLAPLSLFYKNELGSTIWS
jgi:hypothetical protein